jgi:hypothetical protein
MDTVFTEANTYPIAALDLSETGKLKICGDNIKLEGCPGTIKIACLNANPPVLISGKNITLTNIIFDCDFRDVQLKDGEMANAILIDNCHDLTLENCRIIIRHKSTGGADPESPTYAEDDKSEFKYNGVTIKRSDNVKIIRTLIDFRQEILGGIEVRHVCGDNNTSRLYVNGIPIIVPVFTSSQH